jgi:2-C-methyl-D-erythritol 4-phosphate cytidylyltransferase
LEKRDISDTGIHRLHNELKKYMELVANDKILESALEYLANDQEVREFIVYIQSDVYPKIQTTVQRLKEYTDVSAFMCMIFKPQSDEENICSLSTGV